METTSVSATPPHGDVYSSECECRDVLDLVASKWSALIIGRLEVQPFRFGELRRAIPGITQKMLTQTLRKLERDGLVARTVLAECRPPQVEYALTELGVSVTQPLAAMRSWTECRLGDVQAALLRFDG